MKAFIETGKWSFIKSSKDSSGFRKDFYSPIPVPFNYGFIEDTMSGDNEPLDVIVLGKKLKGGKTIDVSASGFVRFNDDDIEDNKIIVLDNRKHMSYKKNIIKSFFIIYSMLKPVIYLFYEHRFAGSRYNGIVWFRKDINDLKELEKVIDSHKSIFSERKFSKLLKNATVGGITTQADIVNNNIFKDYCMSKNNKR